MAYIKIALGWEVLHIFLDVFPDIRGRDSLCDIDSQYGDKHRVQNIRRDLQRFVCRVHLSPCLQNETPIFDASSVLQKALRSDRHVARQRQAIGAVFILVR
jgi:hypothetical protein